MGFGANKTPVEVIIERVFGGTYFRDIYSVLNEKWYKKSWKGFTQIIMMLVLINMILNVEYH